MMSSGSSSQSYPLFDFDANLLHKDLKPKLNEIICNANDYGVQYFGLPGTTVSDSTEIMDLIRTGKYINLFGTCGIHPYHAAEEPTLSEDIVFQQLQDLVALPECLAIGECGLDYSDGFPSKDLQILCFHRQISLAIDVKKPLYLHVRDAHEDFMSILKSYGYQYSLADTNSSPTKVAVHCFTGSLSELKEYVAFGFYIGLTGYIINKFDAEQLKELVALIPSDRLLIETDAPYMGFPGCLVNFETDKKKQKKQRYPNVPSSLIFVAQVVANARGVSLENLAAVTTNNALRFFEMEDRKANIDV